MAKSDVTFTIGADGGEEEFDKKYPLVFYLPCFKLANTRHLV